ncbi:MAG: 2-oxoglutarate dehydrogenase E1 component, partial [Caldithrix sp.]|nr:2-oxoglutarate dehydrogenase E1 component [Caldithrix sp.]
MGSYSYLNNAHPSYIENLYEQYKKDPDSVDEDWRRFFEGFAFAQTETTVTAGDETSRKEIDVLNLINAYRSRGHLFTKTNPVRTRRKYRPTLDIENFNLAETDLETVFQAGIDLGLGPAKLNDIINHLNETYCAAIGAEYMFIRIPERVRWLQQKMEQSRNKPQFSIEQKKRILHKLNQAVVFENFLHTRYVGQKRFSLQGGETLIPGLDAIIEKGVQLGASEFMIGMPHRGRLNVLANILEKSYEEIFSEFEGEEFAGAVFSGDVKYHLGYTSEISTNNGDVVKVGVAPNPSHLEAVDPVVVGMARAKIDHTYKGDASKIVPILIHGDAAIAGQGVVYEVIQMSLLDAYSTG